MAALVPQNQVVAREIAVHHNGMRQVTGHQLVNVRIVRNDVGRSGEGIDCADFALVGEMGHKREDVFGNSSDDKVC